ncbi:MAG TPA: excinuclease ABC subunit UvrA [Kiritimatiellia bacterium]|nr:excinuclease ABC subunit UvrA [Kiritimatiellia bacterium]
MAENYILVEGAREHNLKNITVRIPRGSLCVVTGLSGSGKSSLAFDTLYAEGQRKYVESLSSYARMFLEQLQKPEVDRIEGLSPAIAIEQRTGAANPRSIVATTTEIHDYLRLLYASVGHQHCHQCGKPIARQSAEEIVNQILKKPEGTKVQLLAPLVEGRKGEHVEVFESARRLGFTRAQVDGEIVEIENPPKLDKQKKHSIAAVVDRLVVADKIRGRLTDSVELALKQGEGVLHALFQEPGAGEAWTPQMFSEKNACADCGISFDALLARNFSFNSPYGACPKCDGLGQMLVFDEDLVVPDPTKSIDAGAIAAWRPAGRREAIYRKGLLRALAKYLGFDLATPWEELPQKIRDVVLHGSGEEDVELGFWMRGAWRKYRKPFEGVIPNLQRRYAETDSDYIKHKLANFMSRLPCTACGGKRLKPESLACKVAGKGIMEVMALSARDAAEWFANLPLTEQEGKIAAEVLKEIRQRLKFLCDVGLGYLNLDRESGTLSGGEAQRIRLATQVGAGLVGVLYVLDEPSIGLHQRDNEKLLRTLKGLRDLGNTVVVVEHDEQTIREADYVIDLGPAAGVHGGEVVFAGTVPELLKSKTSLTAQFLNGERQIVVPAERLAPGEAWLEVFGAAENNLKNVDARFPLGRITCVTGVSGSGKSTLVDDILRRALFRKFYGSKEKPGKHRKIAGMQHLDKVIVIDQSPIGRTPRSNPATYTGAFNGIRDLFAQLPGAKMRGYAPGRFSFNVKGGRCEKCKGDGILKIEMNFLPDVYVTCEQCRGRRYNQETLEVKWHGQSIADVLDMTIDEALEFFAPVPAIARKFRTMSEVGLGYLKVGQPATTLSGGEAQRMKLSAELARRDTGRTLYLLDEPTTGLHFADVDRLLQVLLRLRDAGNSLIVIEHNLDVVKTADYIVDLGPEGGDEGGRVVACGTPEEIAANPASHTGEYLRPLLGPAAPANPAKAKRAKKKA